MTLNKENIEEQILLFIDGELDEVAEQQLMDYIEAHPAFQAMLDEYLMAKLDVGETAIFSDKESLMRHETKVIPISKKTAFTRIAAAAAIVIVMLGSLWLFQKEEGDDQTIIAINKYSLSPQNQTTAPQPATDTASTIASIKSKYDSNKTKTKIYRPAATETAVQAHEQRIAHKRTELTPIADLQHVSIQEVQANIIGTTYTIPSTAIATEDKTALPQWLPIKEENLQGFNDLVARIEDLKETIQEKRAQLKSQTIVVSVAGKEFTIGNKQ